MIGYFDLQETQRERNVVRIEAADCGEERCVTALRTAAWETTCQTERLFPSKEEPRFQFQTCNFIGKSKTRIPQEVNKVDFALPLLFDIVYSFFSFRVAKTILTLFLDQ